VLSAFVGAFLALSGLAVLVLLRFVREPRQRAILYPVALLDLIGGAVVVVLGVMRVLP
jgi:hypothetical protein